MPLLGKGALTVYGLVLAASGLWALQGSMDHFVMSLYYWSPRHCWPPTHAGMDALEDRTAGLSVAHAARE